MKKKTVDRKTYIKALPAMNILKKLTVLVVIAMLAIPAYAVTGTLYASGITSPGGQVLLGSNVWVADHVQGFCRLDLQPGGQYGINANTCVPKFDPISGALLIGGPTSPGQPVYDPVSTFVYVPDNAAKSTGVWRLTFDPITNSITKGEVIAPNAGLAGNKPTSAGLSPADGKLYIGFIKTGSIVRISDPSGLVVNQVAETYAGTLSGRGAFGLAFVGPDLYIAEKTGVTKLNTQAPPGGKAQTTPITASLAPSAIVSDGVDTIYVADTPALDSTIIRYTVSTTVQDVYATTGTDPVAGPTTFKFVSGLSLDPSGNLYAGDDPSAGVRVLQGHIWQIPPGPPEIPGAGTPPPPPALKQGVLNASGITSPGGQVWLGDLLTGHLWVSDHVQGFCRLDIQPSGLYAINSNTCIINGIPPGGPVSPGQPSFDPVNNFVYVPDNAAKSTGVYRLTFDPVSNTITKAELIAANAGLAGNVPTASALGSDGKLYIGFLKNGDIKRITTPNLGTQTVEAFGKTSDGKGVIGIAFAGPDLYLAQRGGFVAKIVPAGGTAVATAINALSPTAIASAQDTAGNNYVFVADTPTQNTNVIRYNVTTGVQDIYANIGVFPDGTNTTFKFVSGLSLDSMGKLFVGDDPSAGVQVLQGHIWSIPGALGTYYPGPEGIISGNVFNDKNGNGIKDKGEKGLEDWYVKLTGPIADQSIKTDAKGNYKFEHLPEGTYTLKELVQSGWSSTTPSSLTVVLPEDGVIAGNNFGNKKYKIKE